MSQLAKQTQNQIQASIFYQSNRFSVSINSINNKYKISKISSDNTLHDLHSNHHVDEKYKIDAHYELNKNNRIKFYYQFNKMDLQIDFIEQDPIIKINAADYLSRQINLSYNFKLLNREYNVGFFRNKIDLNISARIRTRIIGGLETVLGAPIYDIDTKEGALIASNGIYFNSIKSYSLKTKVKGPFRLTNPSFRR